MKQSTNGINSKLTQRYLDELIREAMKFLELLLLVRLRLHFPNESFSLRPFLLIVYRYLCKQLHTFLIIHKQLLDRFLKILLYEIISESSHNHKFTGNWNKKFKKPKYEGTSACSIFIYQASKTK